ncbi:MarR family winged helix-turn-helix transcriptional regulator [Microbacterium sp. RG1]|uniref:MarR family winged helix-turn-helix transcriptional regulator n=1 Tax=Microbacterium sp. RG1 TaxID=2489212 RepID=UPI001EE2C226|nr:MarR family transcriptional regulator [Microbacterium sp. RG1]
MTETTGPALDRMLCFSLYSASRATTQVYRRLLEPWQLTYPQYLVLVELWDRGPRTVSQLGDGLGLDSGTLSPLLKRLEKAGLVSRTRDDGDGRVVTVAPTERGTALRAEMSELPSQMWNCYGLEPDAARALLTALHSLTETLHADAD